MVGLVVRKFFASGRLIGVLALAALPQVAGATITPGLAVSRLSGPAPLAVHFDASGTVFDDPAVNTFGELGYRFTFGEAGGDIWPHSGKPKNEQIGGPIAAHVYSKPGTYTATLEVGSIDGQRALKTVQITVSAADDSFAGSKTVCFMMTPADVGCPADATRKTLTTSWGSLASGTRYLLAAGQDFTALGGLSTSCSDCQVGSYGPGAKPLVKKITYAPRPALPQAKNFSVIGLSLGGASIQFGENVLFQGNDIFCKDLASAGIYVGDTAQYYFRNPGTFDPMKVPWPKNIFVVENDMNSFLTADYGIFAIANRLTILGNSIRNPQQHVVRVALARSAFIAHNLLGNVPNPIKHQLKFHSSGLQEWVSDFVGDAPTPASFASVVSSNQIGEESGDVNNWQVNLGPKNAQSIEGHKYEIVEDNLFVNNPSAPGYQVQVIVTGIGMYERGNKFKNSIDPISVGTVGESALNPPEWKGPIVKGQASVAEWLGRSSTTAPPSAVDLQVQ